MRRKSLLSEAQSVDEVLSLWRSQRRIRRSPKSDCMLWLNAKNNSGFGIFSLNGKNYTAHKFILERKLGRELESGCIAYQACKNPACVNPKHLQEVKFSKPNKLTTRIGENTLARLEKLKDQVTEPRWTRKKTWEADTIRHTITHALNALESGEIQNTPEPEPDGKTVEIRLDDELWNRVDQQRQQTGADFESDYALGKRLVETGLQALGL